MALAALAATMAAVAAAEADIIIITRLVLRIRVELATPQVIPVSPTLIWQRRNFSRLLLSQVPAFQW